MAALHESNRKVSRVQIKVGAANDVDTLSHMDGSSKIVKDRQVSGEANIEKICNRNVVEL